MKKINLNYFLFTLLIIISVGLFTNVYLLVANKNQVSDDGAFSGGGNTTKVTQERLSTARQRVESFKNEFNITNSKLNTLLDNAEIKDVTSFNFENQKGWIVNVLSKDYKTLERPGKQYFVTDSIVSDLQGDLHIECSTNSVEVVKNYRENEVGTLAIQWNCGSTHPLVSLVDYNTGNKIRMSDITNNSNGDVTGIIEVIAGTPPVIIVENHNAVPFGSSVGFNGITGERIGFIKVEY